MVEKMMFETFDGKMFDLFADAAAHEVNVLASILSDPNKLTARNQYGKEVEFKEDILRFLEEAQTINVKTEDAFYALDYISILFPYIEFPSCVGMSRWDNDEKRWVSLEEDLACLDRKWRSGCLTFAVRGW